MTCTNDFALKLLENLEDEQQCAEILGGLAELDDWAKLFLGRDIRNGHGEDWVPSFRERGLTEGVIARYLEFLGELEAKRFVCPP